MKTMIRRLNVTTEKNLIQEINHLYYEHKEQSTENSRRHFFVMILEME